MSLKTILIGLAIMAIVTYACRVISFILVRKEIKNKFVLSFLYYLPYSVLAIMVFPKVFLSTDYLLSGIVGSAVALILSFFKKGLLPVAITSILAVFLSELVIGWII